MSEISKLLEYISNDTFNEDDRKEILSEIILFGTLEDEELILNYNEDWKLLFDYTKEFSDKGFCLEKAKLFAIDKKKKQAEIYYCKWLDESYASVTTATKSDGLFCTVLGGRKLGLDLGSDKWIREKINLVPNNTFDFYFFSAIKEDDPKISFDLLFKAYDIDDTSPVLNLLISEKYFKLKIWEQSLKYGLQFLQLADFEKVGFLYETCYDILRASYYRIKNYEKALFYLKEEVELNNDLKNKDWMFVEIYFKLKNYDKCLEYCEIALANKPAKWIELLQKRVEKIIESGNDSDPNPPELKGNLDISAVIEETPKINKENKFVITPSSERDLENHFYSRIVAEGMFGNKRVKLYKEGRQIHLKEAGRVDLFLEDLDSGDFIVLELKNEIQNFQVVEQISRYKDYVQKNIAKPNQHVHGVIAFYHAKEEFINYVKKDFPTIQLIKMNFDYQSI